MDKKECFNYDDIIRLPYQKSQSHPHMSSAKRAAQFLPFAALTGYENEIKESARITNKRIELSEDAMVLLDERLEYINAHADQHLEVQIIYFEADQFKSGGSYVQIRGFIKKIDEIERVVIMDNLARIPVNDIVEINIEI